MYEPREDSLLLLKNIKRFCKNKKVLEIGTGSGILAKEASKYAEKVVACDIDKKNIEKLKRENKNPNIQFIHSNLFSEINQKFSIIIFNPPYLPSKNIKDIELDGGKNGTEVIEKFIRKAEDYLDTNGEILIICSSLNKKIEKLFEKYSYCHDKIDEEKFFFERIYLYKLRKTK